MKSTKLGRWFPAFATVAFATPLALGTGTCCLLIQTLTAVNPSNAKPCDKGTICVKLCDSGNQTNQASGGRPGTQRLGECHTYCSQRQADFFTGPCNSPPSGSGWKPLGIVSGTTCCWVFLGTGGASDSVTNQSFNVDLCDGGTCP